MNRYLVKIKVFREVLFALVITLGLTSCSEYNNDSAITAGKTVFVYMIADNSLDSYVQENVDSMTAGMKNAITDCNLLIYQDAENETPRLLKISKKVDGTVNRTLIKTYAEQNSVSPTIMASVLKDMRTCCPSEHYSLVLWSHGYGWLPGGGNTRSLTTRWFGQDGNNYMDIGDLKTALSSGPHLDSILFDACFMGGVETDYALRNTADYIIASPSEVMGSGFPYQKLIPLLFGMDQTSGIKAAEAYYDYYRNQPVTDSTYPSGTVGCVKCSELDSLAVLTKLLIANHVSRLDAFDARNVQYMESYSPHLFYDLGDFISSFASDTERTAFEAQLTKTVVYKAATPTILSVSSFGIRYVTVNAFSGLNCYIPQSGLVADNAAYHKMEWYMAAGWNETTW